MRTKTTLIACLAALALAAPASAAGPFGAVYSGKISTLRGNQTRHPLTLALSANGKRFKSLAAYWHTQPCTNTGSDYVGTTIVQNVPVKAGGRFSSVVAFSENNPDVAGQKLNHRVEVRGRAGRTKAAGTYRDVITITSPAGAALGTCDTGTVKWAGKRGRNRFGGETGKEQPVGVTRSRRGTRAAVFIQWRADCGGGTFLERASKHSGLRIRRGGAFSKSGSVSFTTDKGAKVTGTFALTGRFSRRRVRGHYTVNAVGTNTAGQRFNCSLTNLPYSASRG